MHMFHRRYRESASPALSRAPQCPHPLSSGCHNQDLCGRAEHLPVAQRKISFSAPQVCSVAQATSTGAFERLPAVKGALQACFADACSASAQEHASLCQAGYKMQRTKAGNERRVADVLRAVPPEQHDGRLRLGPLCSQLALQPASSQAVSWYHIIPYIRAPALDGRLGREHIPQSMNVLGRGQRRMCLIFFLEAQRSYT